MNGALILDQERKGVDAEIVRVPIVFPTIAVNDLKDIIDCRPSDLKREAPINLIPLDGKSDCYVQICPALNYKALWVPAGLKAYKDEYFSFLEKHHGMDPGTLSKDYHVDHIFNASRGREMGFQFLRTSLLEGSINSSHGGGYERLLTLNEGGRLNRGVRAMDTITYLKFRGVPAPPSSGHFSAQQVSCVAHLAKLAGTTTDGGLREVRELLAKANTPWARKG